MSQSSGFFLSKNKPDGNPDRVYNADQFAQYFAAFIGNGVHANLMDELQVSALQQPDMKVQVLSGRAFIDGRWYLNDSPYELQIDISDGVTSRIDSIVVRCDYSARDMYLAVKKGTPSANPSAPSLQRDADAYELQLATVSIGAGTTSIQQASIKDTRGDNSVCGFVTGLIDQIDSSTLFKQFEDAFNKFMESSETDFNEWFETVKDVIPDDVAIPIMTDEIESIWTNPSGGA